MESIGRKLKTKGVIMALLTLGLINIGCEDRIGIEKVSPSGEGKLIEVSLNIGFADETDGASLSASPTTKSNRTAGNQAAFDMQLLSAARTKAVTGNHPDKLYNLDIHQYSLSGSHLASFTVGTSVEPGAAITSTLNDNGGVECSLLIIARGATEAVASLSGKSLSAVNAVTADKAKLETVNASTSDNINNMPYLLYLPKVKIAEGKLLSPEGTDVRLLLKRLAVGLTINWNFKVANYTLTEVRLMQVPNAYRILPTKETESPYGEIYPASLSEFVDYFRLKGIELTRANGTQTLWIPANARGTRNDVTYPIYRNKDYAHPAATYVEFVVDGKGERLLYRAYLGGNATSDFNLLENTNYNWTINLNNANYTNDPRIQLQNLAPVISTNLQPTANCFMIVPGTNICFNPYKHDAEEDGYNNKLTGGWNPYLINENVIGEKKQIAKVKVLWQSKDNATSGNLVMGYAISNEDHSNLVNVTGADDMNNARIHIKVPSTKGGNAVIAAYNSRDTIVWSWHLWITDYVPQIITDKITYEQAQQLTRNGSVHQYPTAAFTDENGVYAKKVLMDRHLCATAGGLPDENATMIDYSKRIGYLYYWGRKDPFFGLVDGTTNELNILYDGDGYPISIPKTAYGLITKVNGNTMEYTIQNPLNIITGAVSWHDNNEQAGAYRYLYADSKTLYDPCPAGWKISNKTIFDGFSTDKGYWYDSDGVFRQKGSDHAKGGRLYNLTGGTGVPPSMTIHNTTWVPKTGTRTNGNLHIISGRGYWGSSTIALAGKNYRFYYIRFNSSVIELMNSYGGLDEPDPFRCVQK